MNAAFLLVTTAWFAGADPALTTTTAPAATSGGAVASAPLTGALGTGGCCGGGAYSGVGGGCGCEVQCCKQGCLQKLKARMHRNNCCCENVGCGCGGGNVGGNVGGCGSNYGGGNVGGCGSNYGGGNVGCCGSNYGGNVSGGCGACCETTCCKQGCLQRLKARMHRNNCCCENVGGCGCGGSGLYGAGVGGVGGVGVPGVMPGAEPIRNLPHDATTPGKKLPSSGTKGTVQSNGLDVTPTSSSNVIETETKNPFELDRRYESRVTRAADYSWVTGQLFYVHADGGLWVLRYAPLWKEDANGGSVILARDRQMDSYREGDLVKVHGEILNQKGSIFLGGPLYRAESIELIDRSAR